MRKILSVLLLLSLLFTLALTVSAQSEQYVATVLIDDQANLLTEAEHFALSNLTVPAVFPLDIVISTVESIDDATPEQFADERYNSISNSENGILLLVAMESRDWYILTVGNVRDIISDNDCQTMADRFLPDLSDGNYYVAFDAFLTNLFTDTDSDYTIILVLVPLVVGIAVGGIVILIMRSKMNSAKPQRTATNYLKNGSFSLDQHLDFYLYSHVTKTPRPQSNSSSSSSSRGGSGGKF